MKSISYFAGVEGFGLGFEQAGIKTVGQCEKDKYCLSVLEHHYPETERINDIRKISYRTGKGWRRYARFDTNADVWTAGVPCQDVSVAGKRAGLAGSQTGLWFEFHRIVTEHKPTWVVIENVPGLLSSNKGKDFAIIIGGLTGIIPEVPQEGWGHAGFARGAIYTVAWRVLNSQYFGVAQRRRRVFIVGHLTRPSYPAKVLFEPTSCAGYPPPSREKSQENPGGAGESVVDFGRTGDRIRIDSEVSATLQGEGGGMGAKTGLYMLPEISNTLQQKRRDGIGSGHETLLPVVARSDTTREGKRHDHSLETYVFSAGQSAKAGSIALSKDISPTLKGAGSGTNQVPTIAFEHRRTEMNEMEEVSPTLNPGGGGNSAPAIAFQQNIRDEVRKIGGDGGIVGAVSAQPGAKQQSYIYQFSSGGGDDKKDTAQTLRSGAEHNYQFAHTQYGVRRLTPMETERLQAFPDIKKKIIIDLCLNHQKNYASAEIRNLKKQKHVGSAEKEQKKGSVLSAESNLNISDQPTNKPAQKSVAINCGESGVEILCHGKSLLFVSFAAEKSWFLPPMKTGDFVRLLAGIDIILEKITSFGKGEFQVNGLSLIPPQNGRNYATLSGKGIMQLVKNADCDLTINETHLKSIISSLSNIRNSDLSLITWFSCVLTAITGYIPAEIKQSNSFRIEINIKTGWTQLGKDGEEISDTQRYKMMGNAVTVSVVRWIGRRMMELHNS